MKVRMTTMIKLCQYPEKKQFLLGNPENMPCDIVEGKKLLALIVAQSPKGGGSIAPSTLPKSTYHPNSSPQPFSGER